MNIGLYIIPPGAGEKDHRPNEDYLIVNRHGGKIGYIDGSLEESEEAVKYIVACVNDAPRLREQNVALEARCSMLEAVLHRIAVEQKMTRYVYDLIEEHEEALK